MFFCTASIQGSVVYLDETYKLMRYVWVLSWSNLCACASIHICNSELIIPLEQLECFHNYFYPLMQMLQRCYKALLTHNGMCVGVFVCYCKGACGHEDEKKIFLHL